MLVKLLNSLHNRLQFTFEKENNSQINFLDILVIKNDDGTLLFDLYTKKTFSGRYLNYYSSHSIQTKIGIAKNLSNKVFTLSDEKFHKKNLDNIMKDLELNSYPKKFIEKHINSQRKKHWLEII